MRWHQDGSVPDAPAISASTASMSA